MAHSITVAPAAPPQDEEIELSIFGPGTGEGILVHCGYGQWFAVDSARLDGECWALWYLRQIGVPFSALKLILASHWHNDHVSGLADLISVAPGATVAFSNALDSHEFRAFLAVFNAAAAGNNRSKVSEFSQCIEIIRDRLQAGTPPVRLASQHLPLIELAVSGIRATAIALSPSTLDTLDALTTFVDLSALGLDHRPRPLSASTPNHASVVLYIQIDGNSIILAADRETRNHPGKGWEVIINDPVLNQIPAEAMKIAHHGSQNGFYTEIWPNIVSRNSVGVVTPFARHRLPEIATMKDYLSIGMQLYATAWPHSVARWHLPLPPRTKLSRPRSMAPGMVRLRKPMKNGAWHASLFGGAIAIDKTLLA